ncbi:MAG TPA: MerR family transcriptional regulator [Jatrophihabitantaceae bacterium]|jgi:DNA-binding transcriptional MerR regulator
MAELVQVSEAARLAGLTAKAVRFYEARGLIPPVARTSAGHRTYTVDDVRTLRFVRRARELGLGLARIKALLELRATGGRPDTLAVLEAHLAGLASEIAVLDARRAEVSTLLDRAREAMQLGEDVRLCRVIAERCPGSVARASC